jgi:heme-degrading monooxygenase HmoA
MVYKPLSHLCVAAVLLVSAGAMAPSAAQTPSTPTGPVTVIVEITMPEGAAPSDAIEALNDMRAMMKKQPGYVSEEFLQNLNASNSPRYVHVSRWASMAYWSALFRTPEFGTLSAHGNVHYTITASAFLAVQ